MWVFSRLLLCLLPFRKLAVDNLGLNLVEELYNYREEGSNE